MRNYTCTQTISGSLTQICEALHGCQFPQKVFLIVSRGAGWYEIDNDVWLMFSVNGKNWQLYYWRRCDPRPFINAITILKGF